MINIRVIIGGQSLVRQFNSNEIFAGVVLMTNGVLVAPAAINYCFACRYAYFVRSDCCCINPDCYRNVLIENSFIGAVFGSFVDGEALFDMSEEPLDGCDVADVIISLMLN